MGDVSDERRVRVYKVGGSLFEWAELFGKLDAFLKSEPGRPVVVAGGGKAADVVREWDRVHGLGERRAHRLAIASLRLGESLLADGLRFATIVANRGDAEAAWAVGRIPVLEVESFIAAEEAAGAEPLPASWDVTSDSIAAWVAWRWPAELVLLKSADARTASEPFVDRHFSNVKGRVGRCEWVNLRTGSRGVL